MNAIATRIGSYCWEVTSLDDLKLAPFHLLAVEGKVYTDKDHRWHLNTLKALCNADPGLLQATAYHVVDMQDEASQGGAIRWWEALTEQGGEGMVVKPYDFHPRSSRGLVQPAVKCPWTRISENHLWSRIFTPQKFRSVEST